MAKANYIHPTAVIDPSAKIGEGNYIGPFCIIGPKVQMGDDNQLIAHCSVGTPPEHRSYWKGEHMSVKLGSRCTLREFVTVNSGTIQDTLVGDDVVFLKGAHVGHDSVVHSEVTLSCNVILAGHTTVFQGANLGLTCSIHEYSRIGHYAMLGMGTVVTKSSLIEPVGVYVGNPAQMIKKNTPAIQRKNLTEQIIRGFMDEFRLALPKSAA